MPIGGAVDHLASLLSLLSPIFAFFLSNKHLTFRLSHHRSDIHHVALMPFQVSVKKTKEAEPELLTWYWHFDFHGHFYRLIEGQTSLHGMLARLEGLLFTGTDDRYLHEKTLRMVCVLSEWSSFGTRTVIGNERTENWRRIGKQPLRM